MDHNCDSCHNEHLWLRITSPTSIDNFVHSDRESDQEDKFATTFKALSFDGREPVLCQFVGLLEWEESVLLAKILIPKAETQVQADIQ